MNQNSGKNEVGERDRTQMSCRGERNTLWTRENGVEVANRQSCERWFYFEITFCRVAHYTDRDFSPMKTWQLGIGPTFRDISVSLGGF